MERRPETRSLELENELVWIKILVYAIPCLVNYCGRLGEFLLFPSVRLKQSLSFIDNTHEGADGCGKCRNCLVGFKTLGIS